MDNITTMKKNRRVSGITGGGHTPEEDREDREQAARKYCLPVASYVHAEQYRSCFKERTLAERLAGRYA